MGRAKKKQKPDVFGKESVRGMLGGIGDAARELDKVDPSVHGHDVEAAEKPVRRPGKERQRPREAARPFRKK